MSNTVSNRIKLIMNHFDLNKNSFSKAIGMTNNVTIGRIIDEQREPSYQVLAKIIQTFGSIDAGWLITGEGIMLKEYAVTPTFTEHNDTVYEHLEAYTPIPTEVKNTKKEQKRTQKLHPTRGDKLHPRLHPSQNLGLPKVVTVDGAGRDNVVLVPVRARAGYLLGYGDPEYIQELPAYHFPMLRNGTFRAFEVDGHSMAPTLKNHDIVVGEYVEQVDHIKDDRIYIVVTKDDGILVKRLFYSNFEDNFIIAKSDNNNHLDEFPPMDIALESIAELWYVKMFISTDLRMPNELSKRMNNLEADMIKLRKELGK